MNNFLMKNENFLVIGDLMLDQYVFGNVKACPECKIDFHLWSHDPVVRKVGGVGNVVVNLASLGNATGDLLAAIGDDAQGKILSNLLRETDFSFHPLPSEQTTIKTRFISEGKIAFRISNEAILHPDISSFRTIIDRSISQKDLILISDYDKGLLNEQTISLIKSIAECPILVNPKRANIPFYRGVDCLILNDKEAFYYTLERGDAIYASDPGAARLYDMLKVKNLIVTLAEDGAYYWAEDGNHGLVETEPHEVVDPSGAGDTFFAVVGLLWGIFDLETIVRAANSVASHCVQHLGNYIPSPKVLESALIMEKKGA